MPLFLDEVTHTYWFINEDGTRTKYDSVSKIIEFLGLSRNYSGVSAFYANRGKAVHKAVELVDKGTLDPKTVSDIVYPYLKAYRKFLDESRYVASRWEIKLHHPVLRFAGTIDKVGTLPGKGLGILDVKTSDGTVDPALDDQLSGYETLWIENFPEEPVAWKYGLQLKSTGDYSLITKYSKTPVEDWLSIMTVYRKKQARQH